MLKLIGNALVYRPIFNILVVLLALFDGHLGWAIIVLTLLIRAMLWNTTKQQSAMQKGMGNMQEKLKALEEKYKDDPTKLSQESMKIMKTDGMGSLKGCLSIFVQIPVFIGLMYVVRSFAQSQISADSIYSFLVPFAGKFTEMASINHWFLGIDLFANHNVVLTIVGCIFVYLQTKLTSMMQGNQPKPAMTAPGGQQMPDMTQMMGPMNLVMVFMMGTFIWSTQNGVGLYLVVTTIFTVVQYAVQNWEMLKIKWMTRGVDTSKKGGVEIVNKKG